MISHSTILPYASNILCKWILEHDSVRLPTNTFVGTLLDIWNKIKINNLILIYVLCLFVLMPHSKRLQLYDSSMLTIESGLDNPAIDIHVILGTI